MVYLLHSCNQLTIMYIMCIGVVPITQATQVRNINSSIQARSLNVIE